MTNLVHLNAEPPGAGIPELIDRLQELFANDELSSVAVAVVHRDGSTGSDWSFAPNQALLIGALQMAAYKLCRDLVDD